MHRFAQAPPVLSRLLFAAASMAAAAEVCAQIYECRSTLTPGQVYRQNVPCAPGTDTRRTPEQERQIRQKMEAEQQQETRRTDNELASMRHEVALGMTTEQVARAWGSPRRVVTEDLRAGTAERWSYHCPRRRGEPVVSTWVHFRNGQVTKLNRAC
jgi:hypothetical protein